VRVARKVRRGHAAPAQSFASTVVKPPDVRNANSSVIYGL